MTNKTKAVLCICSILVIFMLTLLGHLFITKNYEFGLQIFSFIVGSFFAIFIIFILYGLTKHSVNFLKFNSTKKHISTEIVHKKKAIPIYYSYLYIGCICFYIIISFVFILNMPFFANTYFIICLSAGAIFFIKLRQSKTLYLIKNNTNVLNYNTVNNIINPVILSPDSLLLINLQHYLYSHDSLIERKSERIELSNGVTLWSCFSSNHFAKQTSYHSFILSTINYNSEHEISITLNNDPFYYLEPKNKYISKYSNLPPFIISKDISEKISGSIEETCSTFFSKVRSKYVLIIENNTIGLGLKSSRFGKYNRIFNKKKTIQLTNEAIEEISEFLIQMKNILEKY